MNTTEQSSQPRQITQEELAVFVRFYRDFRKWSQEQLAAVSGLNVRTIQRVEQGKPSGFDTRRALARAFEFEDIDAFNKPVVIPSTEELNAAKEKFDREYMTLTALPLTTGKQLAKLAETCAMDMSDPAFELTREAETAFAEMVDYFRDYRDCVDLYTEAQKLEIHDVFQAYIDDLKKFGVSLRYAERKTHVKWGITQDSKPMLVNMLYIVGFPLGKEQEQFAVQKSAGIRL